MQQKRNDWQNSKTKHKQDLGSAGMILTVLLLLSLAICLIITCFYPIAINVSSSGGDAETFTIPARTIYAVNSGSYLKEDEAKLKSQIIISSGGGGYIKNDGTFRVLVSAYPQKANADVIVNRYPEYTHYYLNSPKITFAADSSLKKAVLYPIHSFFDQMHSILLQLEKSEISESYALFIAGSTEDKLEEYFLVLSENSANLEALVAAYSLIISNYRTIIESAGALASRIRYFTLYTLDTYIKGLESYL